MPPPPPPPCTQDESTLARQKRSKVGHLPSTPKGLLPSSVVALAGTAAEEEPLEVTLLLRLLAEAEAAAAATAAS